VTNRLRSTTPNVIAQAILTPLRYGSIYAPLQKFTQEAIVIDPGERRDVAPGDRVIYRPYDIPGFVFEGEHYLVLDEDHLIAKLEA
jgi:hypothetical protein